MLMLQSNKPYLKWTRIEGKSYKVKKYEGPDIHLSLALENKIYCDVHIYWRQQKVFCNFIIDIFLFVAYLIHS